MIKKLLTALILPLFAATALMAQDKPKKGAAKKDAPPTYVTYPDLPSFNIRLLDSFTVYNTFNIPKGKPVLLVLFDPDCKHCKDLTRVFMEKKDSLADIDMYWMTLNSSMTLTRQFYDDFHFRDLKNLKIIGRDYEFFFIDYFKPQHTPGLVLYDENKKYVKFWDGGTTVTELYELTHKK